MVCLSDLHVHVLLLKANNVYTYVHVRTVYLVLLGLILEVTIAVSMHTVAGIHTHSLALLFPRFYSTFSGNLLNQYKEVYAATAEVIGVVLAQMSETNNVCM